MCAKSILIIFLWIASCDAFLNDANEIEERGKKKKIALFVYFADIIIKKIFVLKLIYAFVFWLVIHKAGYFLGWFVSYLKEKKHELHETTPHHHPHHHSDHHYDYGPPHYDPQYGPYKRRGQNF